MRRAVPWLTIGLTAVLVGCSHGHTPPRSAPTPPTPSFSYPPPGNAACPPVAATPLGGSVSDGPLRFTVLAARGPQSSIVGTHAEFPAKGEWVRVRLSVLDTTNEFADLDVRAAEIFDRSGHGYHTSYDAMEIKRQPQIITLGAGNEIQVDEWYDVPRGTDVAAIAVHGEGGCGRAIALPALTN